MSISGLNTTQRLKARELAVRAAMLGLRRAPSLHYTQGGRRWDGISLDLKAFKGECPRYADCSSFATWCLWNGLDHFGVRDTVNRAGWGSGYTGTMVQHGARVNAERNVLRADLALYGDPVGASGHVAIVVGHRNGQIKVVSFGSEPGPFLLDAHYRADLKQFRRYI